MATLPLSPKMAAYLLGLVEPELEFFDRDREVRAALPAGQLRSIKLLAKQLEAIADAKRPHS